MLHTEENHSWLGKRGATSQRWEYDIICKAWRELTQKYPRLTAIQRSRKLSELAEGDDELYRACFEYIAKNFEPLLKRHNENSEQTRPTKSGEQRQEEKTVRDAEIESIKEQMKQQILLNEIAPNGKRIRHCTMDYLYRLGGAFKACGQKGNQKLVGHVYDEDGFKKKYYRAGGPK